jgi:hypothetical protein
MKSVLWNFVSITLFCSSAFSAGRLVAIADDWPLGTPYNSSNNGDVFTKSALNWLTAGTSNKTVLFDGYLYQNQWWALTPLKTYLQNAGYSITVANTSTWNSQSLAPYGAVIWASIDATGSGTALSDYSNNGGNILYVGGFGYQPSPEAVTLLNTFGIQDAGVAYDNRVTLTTFSNHPCVAGVNSLIIGGSTTLNLLPGFSGVVASAQGGQNFIIAAPEPCSLALLALGSLLLHRRNR